MPGLVVYQILCKASCIECYWFVLFCCEKNIQLIMKTINKQCTYDSRPVERTDNSFI